MKSRVIFHVFMLVGLTAFSQKSVDDNQWGFDNPVTFGSTYIADGGRNFIGGIATGNVYLGMVNLSIGFDTDKAGWWKGGNFYFKGTNLHGDSPTDKLVGDFQTLSNIDAGEHTYIQELWYLQSLGNVDITIGVQDLNAEFVTVESGGVFINSSFGIPSVISDNVPVPIFPLTAPAITTKWQMNGNIVWLNAFFDGKPTEFEQNRYNTNWKINRDEGMLAISEIQLSGLRFLPEVLKVGAYYHSGLVDQDEATGEKQTIFKDNYGAYCLFDHQLWQKNQSLRRLSVFGQAVFSPTRYNHHHLYLGGGVNFTGVFNAQNNDIIGLGIAYALFNHKQNTSETCIELSLKKEIGEHFFVQPDLQYIVNPSGTENQLDNALTGFVRIGLSF